MNKYKLTLCVTFLLLLVFSGCPNLIINEENAEDEAPDGMGYFSLLIDGARSSRTIMPSMPPAATLYYKMEFLVFGTSTVSKVTDIVHYTSLAPVLLNQGDYDLTVSAYKDSAGANKIAESKKVKIVIVSKQTTETEVLLEPITTGSEKGSFKWIIDYPEEVINASMTIEKITGGDPGTTYYFKGFKIGDTYTAKNASVPLDAGHYYVTFSLSIDAKILERVEILHIYPNMESSYTNTFTLTNFFAMMTGIEVEPQQTVYALGEPLKLTVYAVYDDGSKSVMLGATTSNYKTTEDGIGDQFITIRHTSSGFTNTMPFRVTVLGYAAKITLTGVSYPTLNGAMKAAANGYEESPTEIVILRDITAPEWDMTTNGYAIPDNKHIKLTVEPAQSRIITASAGGFRLFSFGSTSSSLTLGPTTGDGKLTLSGGDAAAAANRNAINVSKKFTMNDGITITGFKNTNNGSGGVYVYGGTFKMNGGEISGNEATSSVGGGGVCLSGGTFEMTGGTIEENISLSSGGGVYLNTSGNFTMSGNAKIINNEAKGNVSGNGGGGVYTTKDNSGTFAMSGNAQISGNKAINNGGGVLISAGTFAMSGNAQISNNTGNNNGGGVYVSAGKFTMSDNAKIIGNEVNNTNGGGVYKAGTGDFAISGIAQISGNTARSNGGGVFVSAGKFTISDNAKITDNEVTNGGAGGVYKAGDGDFTMTGGTISGNTATSNGGGVYVLDGNFTMSDNAKISGNEAKSTTWGGGGVYKAGDGKFDMKGGVISENTATNAGGGMYVSAGNFEMSGDAKIIDNKAKAAGGVFFNNSSGTFEMKDGEISGNTTTDDITSNGGGVYIGAGNFEMSGNAKIIGNEAKGNHGGGGVYKLGSGTFDMKGGTIAENTATTGGGGVYITAGNFEMSGNAKIIGNEAIGNGGGVYMSGSGTFTMSGTAKISNNTATSASSEGRGGGLYVNNATFNMSGGVISGNSATGSTGGTGGGVYKYGTGNINMSGGTIGGTLPADKNSAGYYGGGIQFEGSGDFTMSGTAKIIGNETTGYYGGGVCWSSSGIFSMTGGTIAGNKANGKGGGVSVNGSGIFTMSGGEISGNTASGGGGVSVNSGKTFKMSGGTIYGSSAGAGLANNATSGASLYNDGGTANYDGVYGTDTITSPNNNTLPDAPIFTTAAQLATYLTGKGDNTTSTPYLVKMNVDYIELNQIKLVLGAQENQYKYVSLDLSGSTTITNIPTNTFNEACNTLTSLIIPNTVTSIGDNAFHECLNFTSVTIPYGVISIGECAFESCSLTSINIPNSVISIGEYAFSYGAFTTVTIPNSVTNIGNSPFHCCPLETIIVASDNTAYTAVDGVLYNKAQTTLIQYPIRKTDSSFIIPNGVTTIESNAFYGCSYLTSVTIPNTVTSIGDYAFLADALTIVTFNGTIPLSNFSSTYPFRGDLRAKFYANNPTNGTPGTYTRSNGGTTWTKQ